MALFVVSLWEWMVPRDANINVPLEPTVATENLLTAQPEPAEVVLPDETVMVDPSEKLRQKWQLSGIAKIGGASVMILSDRYDKTIRRISAKDDLNGWTVTDIGSNYAIFAQNGEEVRLVLNEEAVR